MYTINLTYNPDHEQVLEYHKELLKKAEQERLTHPAMTTSKHPLPALKNLLRLVTPGRHTNKTAPIAPRSSSA